MSKKTERFGGVVIVFIAILASLLVPAFLPLSCASAAGTCSTGGSVSVPSNPTQTASTIDEAAGIAQSYLKALNSPNLAIDEVIEFKQNFEVIYYDRVTGIGAFVITISKPGAKPLVFDPSGYPKPEQGPYSIWNVRYGPTSFPSRQIYNGIVDANTAKAVAQVYLDQNIPSAKVGDMHPFYGFFSFKIVKDGKVYGMLSVNAYTRAVLYHDWQSDYVQTRELSNDWSY